MKFKRRICMLLTLCMLFSAICLLSSCQKDNVGSATTESATSNITEATDDITESEISTEAEGDTPSDTDNVSESEDVTSSPADNSTDSESDTNGSEETSHGASESDTQGDSDTEENSDSETESDLDTTTDTSESSYATTEETTTEEETTEEKTTEEKTTEEKTTEPETTVEETSKAPEFTTLEDPSSIALEEMPRIDINTEGGVDITSKDYYVRAQISVSRCDDKYIRTNLEGGIRARGNSTFGAPKKPYRIKFDKKQNLLGLNGEKHFKNWVLMADYFDASMLRTFATFKLAAVLLEGQYYSSDCIPVEVFLNGNYHGVYLLCEQTQINPGRVNIYEKDDDETSLEIGYLMIGQGGRTDEPETVVIPANITVTDRTGATFTFGSLNFALSGSGYTEEQKAYVTNYVEGVFKVLRGALYEDKYYTLSRDGKLSIKPFPAGKTKAEKQIETIDAVFNIESAVALCALDEIVKNLDAMTFNMYVDLSPKGDARLTLAAPWDFDFSMANTHYSTTHSYKGFYATNISYSEGMRTNLFYIMFGSVDWFEEMVCELWQEKYTQMQQVVYDVLLYSYKYQKAYNRDWERWGSASGRLLIHHHASADLAAFTKHLDNGTLLYTWLTKRLEWLDRQWGNTEYPEGTYPDIVIDFTKEESINLTSNWKRCEGVITTQGLLLSTDNGYDPYFTIELESFEAVAEDYPYIEVKMKIPTSNSKSEYHTEIFLSSGTIQYATGGISVSFTSSATGTYATYKINLEETGFWIGDIHRIRLDYFSGCNPGDVAYVEYIKLTSK